MIHIADADPHEGDRLGRLRLSKEGLAARDDLVYRHCRKRGLSVAVIMGGGYAHDVNDIVDIHYQSVALAASLVHTAAYWQWGAPVDVRCERGAAS